MKNPVVAMQVGAVSFVDEGTEQVLDNLQDTAGVNCLFLANFTYSRGTGGRQMPGHPFPDHGAQEYDLDWVGGEYATGNPAYFRRTFIRPEDYRAQEHGDLDIMAEVIPAARRRGIKTYAWIQESTGVKQTRSGLQLAKAIPNFAQVLELDPRGRRGRRPCFSHPEYRQWHMGLVEDYVKSYQLDGIAWCSERQGPLGNLLDGMVGHGEVACFCEHCRARAREQGISVERARQGYLELEEFIAKALGGTRPADGYFVSFWRLLLKYPELLAWENLWHEGQRQLFRELYGICKAIAPEIQVGWHVYMMNSFSPFYRATQDYAEMSHYSDFIKPTMYNNCAGPRFAKHIAKWSKTVFRDAEPAETLQLMYRFLGIEEGSLTEIPTRGWSADYVRRETRRAIDGVTLAGNSTAILPGIDVDITTNPGEKQTEPDDVYQSVTAALDEGAAGVVLSRKYSEMKLANLAAAGQAVRDYERRWA